MKKFVSGMLIAVALLATLGNKGCSKDTDTGKTTALEMEQTEENHARLVGAVPPPKMTTSQERKNLVERLKRFNTDSKVSYIYLIDFGKIMAFYTVKGKVSSVNSLLTTPDQIVTRYRTGNGTHHIVIPSPDLDGSYGSNGDAVFFFCTDGTYVEWNGRYMLCDKPLKLTQQPELVIQVKEE